jgi:hypothetical protein
MRLADRLPLIHFRIGTDLGTETWGTLFGAAGGRAGVRSTIILAASAVTAVGQTAVTPAGATRVSSSSR